MKIDLLYVLIVASAVIAVVPVLVMLWYRKTLFQRSFGMALLGFYQRRCTRIVMDFIFIFVPPVADEQSLIMKKIFIFVNTVKVTQISWKSHRRGRAV